MSSKKKAIQKKAKTKGQDATNLCIMMIKSVYLHHNIWSPYVTRIPHGDNDDDDYDETGPAAAGATMTTATTGTKARSPSPCRTVIIANYQRRQSSSSSAVAHGPA